MLAVNCLSQTIAAWLSCEHLHLYGGSDFFCETKRKPYVKSKSELLSNHLSVCGLASVTESFVKF